MRYTSKQQLIVEKYWRHAIPVIGMRNKLPRSFTQGSDLVEVLEESHSEEVLQRIYEVNWLLMGIRKAIT